MTLNQLHLSIKEPDENKEDKNRLFFLKGGSSSLSDKSNRIHTRLVRWMRLFLPMLAIAIVWLVISWPGMEDAIPLKPTGGAIPQTIGQNELLRPRFQSMDNKEQPFNITAHRASQSTPDPSIVLLERPMADMALNNGAWIAVESTKGTYKQKANKLLLEEKVKLYHDDGYQLETEKLLVNLDEREAWSDVEVYGQGPAGMLKASGMQALTKSGKIIFTGPVTLKLNKSIQGL